MPASVKASELLAEGKLFYGDPCYDAKWGDTKENCRQVGTPGDHLALQVLNHYDIDISSDSDSGYEGGQYSSDYLCCCPLDILNQDPIQVMNMSLHAKLLDEEYWECYADEFGEAKFIKVLDGPTENPQTSPVPRIQHCVPTIQPADIANLVIVRGADPAPFRKCGEWYTVADGTVHVLKNRQHIFFDEVLNEEDIAKEAKAVAFTWGEVTGYNPNFGGSFSVDSTCEFGTFNQYGTIIYPDYERKQIYADGIRDVFELAGFEQVLFWITDIQYDVDEDIMKHYSVSFTKSAKIPVNVKRFTKIPRVVGRDFFGPLCDVVEGDPEYADYIRTIDYPDTTVTDTSCQSVQGAVSTARQRQDSYVAWAEYAIPSFYDYGRAYTDMSFKEVTKWSIAGSTLCDENPFETLYESTNSMAANASVLQDWRGFTAHYWGGGALFYSQEWVDFGYQKERRTIDIANEYWMEATPESDTLDEIKYMDRPEYLFRSVAPKQATYKTDWEGDIGWHNPIYDSGQLLTMIYNRYAGTGQSLGAPNYDPPGYLMGMNDTLYLLHDLWAEVTVNRPGIFIKGHGRGVDSLLPHIKMRVMPVYRVDFPAAYSAAGENWPVAGCDYCIDPYDDLVDSKYCEVRIDEPTCSEKLQEAESGNTLDITLPFLFPDFAKYDPAPGGGAGGDRRAFDENCEHTTRVARFLWDYIKKYKDNPHKSYTYVCGPPKTQSEVPQLGHSIRVPGGDTRCVNGITFSYSDSSSFSVNIDVGPVSLSSAVAGRITQKRSADESVRGRIISHEYGALYKVDIPGLGVIKAWNIDPYPWDTGDRVDVTLYNHPIEI